MFIVQKHILESNIQNNLDKNSILTASMGSQSGVMKSMQLLTVYHELPHNNVDNVGSGHFITRHFGHKTFGHIMQSVTFGCKFIFSIFVNIIPNLF